MSTPSTATATHPAQHYGYPHSSYQTSTSYPTPTTTGARLANSYAYSIPSPTTATLPYTQSSRVAPTTSTPSGMASHPSGSSAAPSQSGRRKKPDWGEFYKNGIPQEVIVIDDSPGPDSGKAAPPLPNNGAPAAVPPPPVPYHPGKRRRTGLETTYGVGNHDRPSFSINPQQYGEASSHSLSTDRTTSLHTTAPTSLGSQGSSGASNGVYYEDASAGQKRKRTTRKSTRDEQKRRELENVGDAFLSYVPPPHPVIKAKDVPVPVVRDVSDSLSSPQYRLQARG